MRFGSGRGLPPASVYYIWMFCSALFSQLVFTASGVFALQEARLDPLQLILVGTALEGACFLFEVPTGVVADVYSRRLSIIIGVTVLGIGYLVWGAAPLFLTIVLAQLLWGLGYTFTSGAGEAWLADEIGEERLPRTLIRGSQCGQVGVLLGIPAGIALASVQLNFGMLIGGLLMLGLAVFLLLVMGEHGFTPTPREGRNSWQAMGYTFGEGLRTVRASSVLITILLITLIAGAASESFDRLFEAHFLQDVGLPRAGNHSPVFWFGVITIGVLIASIGVSEVVRRRANAINHRSAARFLLVSNLLLTVSVAGFALAGHFAVAVAFFGTARLLRRINAPLYVAWLNHGLEPRVRATVLSMGGQADALGQVAGGPLFGLLATAVSVPVALFASAVVLMPTLGLYLRTLFAPEQAGLAGPLPVERAAEG